jgi:predicted ATPase with chaperone activity
LLLVSFPLNKKSNAMPSTVLSAASNGIKAYPVVLGVLVASKQIKPARLGDYALLGELSLNGSVRPLHGMLSMAASLDQHGL